MGAQHGAAAGGTGGAGGPRGPGGEQERPGLPGDAAAAGTGTAAGDEREPGPEPEPAGGSGPPERSGSPGHADGAGAAAQPRGSRMPWAALTLLGAAGALIGYLAKWPCRFGGAWLDGGQYAASCYSDVFPLYYRDGLDEGALPYLDRPLEYPVLTGGLMHLLGRAVAGLPSTLDRAFAYFDLTALAMGLCLVATALATGWIAGRGGVLPDAARAASGFDRRRALLAGGAAALLPAVVLTAYINWDLLAVALFTAGLGVWGAGTGSRAGARGPALQWAGGALIGLAVAAKFYPFLAFGPLLVLWLRGLFGGALGRTGGISAGALFRPLGGAAAAWAAVNLPVAALAPENWATFFTFSQERGTDWGSVYYVLGGFGLFDSADGDLVNSVGVGALALACAGVAAIGLFARRPPRPEQLVFLVVAAFLMTNKVWSPQFVLWLVPLAVLAWPRTMGVRLPAVLFALWQLAEAAYFFGVWQHLLNAAAVADPAVPDPAPGLGFEGYAAVSLARFGTLLLLAGAVVADLLRRGKTVAGLR
ncbi:glycosyltransferase 87 family protein [Nocardiopsis coralliicola]